LNSYAEASIHTAPNGSLKSDAEKTCDTSSEGKGLRIHQDVQGGHGGIPAHVSTTKGEVTRFAGKTTGTFKSVDSNNEGLDTPHSYADTPKKYNQTI
jgi:hypothetical protein